MIVYSDYTKMKGVIAWGFVLVNWFNDKRPDSVFFREGGVFTEGLMKVPEPPYESNVYEELAGRKAYEYIERNIFKRDYENIIHYADHPFAFSDANVSILLRKGYPEIQKEWVHRGNLAHAECRTAARAYIARGR